MTKKILQIFFNYRGTYPHQIHAFLVIFACNIFKIQHLYIIFQTFVDKCFKSFCKIFKLCFYFPTVRSQVTENLQAKMPCTLLLIINTLDHFLFYLGLEIICSPGIYESVLKF